MRMTAGIALALVALGCGTDSADGSRRVVIDDSLPDDDAPSPDPCADLRCSGHGRCVDNGGYPACVCDAGYRAADTACVAGEETPTGGDAGPVCGIIAPTALAAAASNAQPGYSASKVLDGTASSFWLTPWIDGVWTPTAPLPQSLTLALVGPRQVTALRYTPPDQVNDNGIITQYRVLTSSDGSTFTAIAEGDWPEDKTAKTLSLTPTAAAYVRLEVLAGHGGFAGAGELGLEGCTP
jgi:hypothetical protein